MATAISARPASPMPLPSTPKRRNTSDGSSTGLRNSCEACASSKVKCSGRKPTCDRCEKRGFTCEYFQAKRAGRKPAGSASTASHSSGGTAQTANSAEQDHDPVGASDTRSSENASPALISDIWRDVDHFDRSLFSDLTNVAGSSTGFTPAFSMDLPALDMAVPSAQMTSTDDLFSSTMQNNATVSLRCMSDAALQSSNDAATADLFAFPLLTPNATTTASPVNRPSQGLQRSPTTPQPCSCLAQALSLLRRLSELMCSTGGVTATNSSEEAIQNIQHILQQNKVAIELAVGMLNCQGRHDGYLLIVMCLTTFKTMELFAAALPDCAGPQCSHGRWTSQATPPNAPQGDPYRIEGEDWARQSVQAILGELHGVRRLTRLLSEKLQLQTMTRATPSSTGSSSGTALSSGGEQEPKPSSKQDDGFEGEARLSFSREIYQQLESDLNNRVISLSQQMLQRLRNF